VSRIASVAPRSASGVGPPRTVVLADADRSRRERVCSRLRASGYHVEQAADTEHAVALVRELRPAAVLSDTGAGGDLDGFVLCRRLREDADTSNVPVVLLSSRYRGEPDEQLSLLVGASALVCRTDDFDVEEEVLRRALSRSMPPDDDVLDTALCKQHLRANTLQLVKTLGHARTAEERYRTLFENAADTITVLTPDGVVLEANRRWTDILGVPPAEMVGHHIREFAAPGHETENVNGFVAALASGCGRVRAVPIARPDGRIVYMEFSTSLIDLGGRRVALSIGHDVTAEVQSAERAGAAERRYRSLLERIPDVIWTATVDGTITFATANVASMCGYTAEELCAEDLETRAERVHPDDRAPVKEAFRALAEHGTPFDIEYRRMHKDGQWVWLRNRGTATYEVAGVRYIEGIMTDITEKKLLEDSFRQAQKMEAIGQLTGGIAHDFNNILAAILAYCHLLIEDLVPQDPRRADAEEIKLAAERAAALTRQLLAFSRKQLLEPTIVGLDATVAGLEKMLRRMIGEDIELSVERGVGVGNVRVDVCQLEQVIMNLVVNARDAMPRGGKLYLSTATANLDAVTAKVMDVRPGRYLSTSVRDTGCGMDAATRERIFEPFFTTKAGRGTGLGLSTCYGIVKQSGGHISVRSEPGKGSVFDVLLPRIDDHAGALEPATTPDDLRGGETILLIEDDDLVRAAVSRLLKARGYRPLCARSGVEAIALARRHGHDVHLVLSDVVMPEATGPVVVGEVKEHCPAARVLFMSGHTDHALLDDEALSTSANFIQKPFKPDALARKLRELLDA
jgi:two-component system, cell cycle sensor histidine kinase and response regulator CckA